MSILNKYKRWIPQLLLVKDRYLDFVLSQHQGPSENCDSGKLKEECLISFIDFDNPDCIIKDGSLTDAISDRKYVWENAVNTGDTLNDIGFTGTDNGLILFDRETITNEEFFRLLTGSTYDLSQYGKSFKMRPVSGNTGNYIYPCEYNEDEGYYKFNGGFLQGFYKTFGHEYQVLPNTIENCWHFEFVLRPMDYETSNSTLNKKHEGNDGIFFYIGTRAENKFARYYNSNIDSFPSKWEPQEYCSDDYFQFDWDFSKDEISKRMMSRLLLLNFLYSNFSNTSSCSNRKKFEDKRTEMLAAICENYLNDKDFYEFEQETTGYTIETSAGNNIKKRGYFEIETDNKYLFFNRTKDGFLARDWDGNTGVVLTGYTRNRKENLFLVVHKGKGGLIASDIESQNEESGDTTEYLVEKDALGNSFALIANPIDGSIGYRYLVKDCDSESGYSTLSEFTYPGIINIGQWNVVNVMIEAVNGGLDECENASGPRKIRICIYVNGLLKLVSKELPDFNFRELDESYDKQEGVPFNISLGGGTQGLCDTVSIDYKQCFDKILPIEQYFAGSFIGDIKSFKFYNCRMSYAQIRNNYLYEMNKIKIRKNI